MSLTAHANVQWYLPEQLPEPTRLHRNDDIVLLCVEADVIVTGEYSYEDKRFFPHGNVKGEVTHWTWFDKEDWPSMDIYMINKEDEPNA